MGWHDKLWLGISLLMLLMMGCVIQEPPPPSAQEVAAQIERDYANSQPQTTAPTSQAEQSPNSATTSADNSSIQPSAMAQEQAVSSLKGLSTSDSLQSAAKILYLEQSSFINQGVAGDETNAMGSIAAALNSITADQAGNGFVLLCTYSNMHWAPVIANDLDGVGQKPWTPTESAGLTDQQMADYDALVEFTSGVVTNVPSTCSSLIANAQNMRHHTKHRHQATTAPPPITGMHTL
jgi:hypothetical protein